MVVEVYGMALSAPCRTVYLTCELLGVDYKKVNVDLMKGEHMTPEFLSMNPAHTVPTMKDGDFVLTQSRAIATYLVSKYGKDGCKLYPSDVETRAKIDDVLYFDATSFYDAFGKTCYPLALNGIAITDEAKGKFKEVLKVANGKVKATGYAAGTSHITVADLAMLASYSTMKAIHGTKLDECTELNEWFERVKKEAKNYEDADGKGAAEFGAAFSEMMKKNAK